MNILLNIIAALTINITGISEVTYCEVQPAAINSDYMDENGGAYCKDLYSHDPLFEYNHIIVTQKDSIKPIQAGQVLKVTTNTKDAARSIETIQTTSKYKVK